MRLLAIVMCVLLTNVCYGDAWDELCEWRRRSGLPQLTEDPEMTKFAQNKANYRAYYHLQNGHQGPRNGQGWREGTGEATADWGWLTCCMEDDATYGGAGICVGTDGQRYMVLVVRGGSGRSLCVGGVHNTSYLTPDPPRYR